MSGELCHIRHWAGKVLLQSSPALLERALGCQVSRWLGAASLVICVGSLGSHSFVFYPAPGSIAATASTRVWVTCCWIYLYLIHIIWWWCISKDKDKSPCMPAYLEKNDSGVFHHFHIIINVSLDSRLCYLFVAFLLAWGCGRTGEWGQFSEAKYLV